MVHTRNDLSKSQSEWPENIFILHAIILNGLSIYEVSFLID